MNGIELTHWSWFIHKKSDRKDKNRNLCGKRVAMPKNCLFSSTKLHGAFGWCEKKTRLPNHFFCRMTKTWKKRVNTTIFKATSFINSNNRFNIKHLYFVSLVQCTSLGLFFFTFALQFTNKIAYSQPVNKILVVRKYLIIIWQRNYCYRFHWKDERKNV